MSEKALDFIDSTTTEIKNALNSDPPREVCVRLRRAGTRCVGVKYSWPGNTVDEALRFSRVLAILSEIKAAIEDNVVITKRDIYYHFPELFGKQDAVDRYIDDIALTCGVSRADLHVTASPKGLVCGVVPMTSSEDLASKTHRMQIIPTDLTAVTEAYLGPISWMLLIEKEATFNALAEVKFDQRCEGGSGILVTAKGYPDLNTLLFVRHVYQMLRNRRPSFRIFSLTDGDPDGVEIHRCFGSLPAAYAEHSEILDITRLGVDPLPLLSRNNIGADSCVLLTKRDRRRAQGLLERLGDEGLRQCLRTMLMLGIKLEIQAIDSLAGFGGLAGWLEGRICDARRSS